MKIISSGFGRTGTSSLREALVILGFGPCYHMDAVLSSPANIRAWYQISQGEPADWQAVFAGYNAAVDFPASAYYQEIMAAFPDAKVIHTVRDPERWYDSAEETIYQGQFLFPAWLQQLVPTTKQFVELQRKIIWQRALQGQFENRERAVEVFNEHTETVQRVVPAERLLVYRVAEGWEPLCNFLEVPVPDVPFPNINDREAMKKLLGRIRFVAHYGLPIVAAVLLLVLLGLIVS